MPIRKRAVLDTEHPPGEARIPWRDTLQDNIEEFQESMPELSDEQIEALGIEKLGVRYLTDAEMDFARAIIAAIRAAMKEKSKKGETP